MAAKKNRNGDRYVEQIRAVLEAKYQPSHPNARIDVKRYNSVSVRVRIIDPDFAGRSRTDRDEEIWGILQSLPEDYQAEISALLLITPREAKTSLMNQEFEDPTPSPF
jgi:stress-induced morphogen